MPTVFEKPILNSPFRESRRVHEHVISGKVADDRCRSTYLIRISTPKRKVAAEQIALRGTWTSKLMPENDNIDCIRSNAGPYSRGMGS